MSEWPTLGMFEALVDQPFDVDVGGRSTLSLTLESSKSLGERPHRLDGTDVRESFSLLFRGPAEPVLPQAIYRFVSKGSVPESVGIRSVTALSADVALGGHRGTVPTVK